LGVVTNRVQYGLIGHLNEAGVLGRERILGGQAPMRPQGKVYAPAAEAACCLIPQKNVELAQVLEGAHGSE
jgi:hypothetical protein